MSGLTQVPICLLSLFAYGAFTLFRWPSQIILLSSFRRYDWPFNTENRIFGLGSSHFARRYYGNLGFDFFSSAYWDVSLQRVLLMHPMYSAAYDKALLLSGSPIRISSGRSLYPALRSFSQVSTSFFAYRCQGIHQQPLIAWTQKLFVRYLLFELDFRHSIFYILKRQFTSVNWFSLSVFWNASLNFYFSYEFLHKKSKIQLSFLRCIDFQDSSTLFKRIGAVT